jgi:hypothetical protein
MKIQKHSDRSAELHSAVSRIFNPQRVEKSEVCRVVERSAECNSAMRQIKNLRYVAVPRQALLHCQSTGAAHSPAFTGLFTT